MSAATAQRTGTVDLWLLPLDLPDAALAGLRESLNQEELGRAARFRFTSDANRFVAGRGRLRQTLAGYLDLTPAAVEFTYGRYGKPSVADARLDFNLAHSEGLALLAVTSGTAVGVDIEFSRPGFGGMDIAERFFAPGELHQLAGLPESEQEPAFLRCWTRKEAYVKAHGAGLNMELDSFEVSLSAAPVTRLSSSRTAGAVERWSLVDVSDPVAGYHAAVAVEDPDATVRHWSLGEAGSA